MKKSLYVFLSSMMGMLLFLVIHRLVIFVSLLVLKNNYDQAIGVMPYYKFLALDYLTLFITLLLGAWYGIWVGIYWYGKVYEEQSHFGFVDHVANRYWPTQKGKEKFESKLTLAKKKIEENLWELEELADSIPAASAPAAVKRKIVRKRTVKK